MSGGFAKRCEPSPRAFHADEERLEFTGLVHLAERSWVLPPSLCKALNE